MGCWAVKGICSPEDKAGTAGNFKICFRVVVWIQFDPAIRHRDVLCKAAFATRRLYVSTLCSECHGEHASCSVKESNVH